MDHMVLGKKVHENVSKQLLRCVDEKLLSDVAHKIKNGLGGIGGFATLLERDLESDDPRKRLALRIQDGVKKVNELVVSLMTLVRVAEPRFEKVKLLSLLRDILRGYWDDEREPFQVISIHPDVKEDELVVHADPQMIQKMLDHAIRFTNLMGGRIESIHMNPQRRGKLNLEFYFLDNVSWKPLSEDIFQSMSDIEPVEARLSLAIVDKMARLHGGKVSLVSYENDQKVLKIHIMKGR